MVTVKIPEEVPDVDLIDKIKQLANRGLKSVEFNVRSYNQNKLILCNNLFLEDLFQFMRYEHLPIQIVLNLLEPYLEGRVRARIEKWDLKDKVKYTGNIMPDHFSLRERPHIYYNVSNCLPNFYQLATVKKAHFDVIHYFCRKYKIKAVRLNIEAWSEDFSCWTDDHDLKLSIYGVDSYEQAKELLNNGVSQVTTTDASVYMNEITKKAQGLD